MASIMLTMIPFGSALGHQRPVGLSLETKQAEVQPSVCHLGGVFQSPNMHAYSIISVTGCAHGADHFMGTRKLPMLGGLCIPHFVKVTRLQKVT